MPGSDNASSKQFSMVLSGHVGRCNATITFVGVQDDGYTKAGPLPRINPSLRVNPSRTPLAKLGRALAAYTWNRTTNTLLAGTH